MATFGKILIPARPTEVGDRVRALGYGGVVRLWMVGLEGTVQSFSRKGNPLVLLDHQLRRGDTVPDMYLLSGHVLYRKPLVSDTYGCFAKLDDDGAIMREEVEVR